LAGWVALHVRDHVRQARATEGEVHSELGAFVGVRRIYVYGELSTRERKSVKMALKIVMGRGCLKVRFVRE
jgi:hypothetical protein